MSLEITIGVTVGEGDDRLITVGRTESVLPATEATEDLADLATVRLDRMLSEVRREALAQMGQLKEMMSG